MSVMSAYNPTVLKELRTVLGWTVQDLHERCQQVKFEVSISTLENWENGNTVPDADKLGALAMIFGVGIERFYQPKN